MTPRLRVTSLLSLLALLVGVLGTQWLSGRTAEWSGPRHAVAAVHTAPPAATPRPAHARTRHGRATPPRVVDGVTAEGLQAAGVARAVAAPPTLVPLRMPPRSGERYDAVRDHLRGRLVLSLRIDGSGDVQTVAVQQSSGDPVLDDYARRLVAGWQFAVPPGYPAGLSGELPMRFDDARADPRP